MNASKFIGWNIKWQGKGLNEKGFVIINNRKKYYKDKEKIF